ncbi:SMP-30/gluconolactonase/LRE family protein [Chondromyces crocatus]|uniref:Strictosidine synthase n=1 Tax=Chondromyces crocatus TaxID=52 RepID=A0A0K1EHP3_CHOCO|nr:SMP-30/gluconolactonase/LRE family protein [Chondromyces crocatus]AKT40401.1 strictosidine synthase [Chondromyces crocatus]
MRRVVSTLPRPSIEPVVWHAPPAPARATQRASQEPLPPLTLLPLPGSGPEDVVVDAEGWIYTGLGDGRILRVSPDGSHIITVANTGGRPLGLEILPDGAVLICDPHRGLLRLDPATRALQVLVDRVDGRPLRFCSNVTAARDGTLYFTESTQRFGFEHWKADILEHTGSGRLFRLDPQGKVEVLLQGLHFANGVVLTHDETAVLVAETGRYQLTRLWLRGPREGRREVLVENLPGFPDNMSRGLDGRIWIAMANGRDPMLDRLLGLPPIVRKVVWALPEKLQPDVTRTTWVLAIDEEGTIVQDLQGPGEQFHMVTGVAEAPGMLVLGSLAESALAVLRRG